MNFEFKYKGHLEEFLPTQISKKDTMNYSQLKEISRLEIKVKIESHSENKFLEIMKLDGISPQQIS